MTAIFNGTFFRAALIAVGIGCTSAPAVAGDAAAGKAKAAVCAACHGQDGKTPIDPSYAILAGQHEDYLVVALKGYRSGLRKNAIMGAQAQQLSTADIENLAAYYAGLPGPMGYKK